MPAARDGPPCSRGGPSAQVWVAILRGADVCGGVTARALRRARAAASSRAAQMLHAHQTTSSGAVPPVQRVIVPHRQLLQQRLHQPPRPLPQLQLRLRHHLLPRSLRPQRLPARFALLRRPLCRPLRHPAPRPKRTWTWRAIGRRRLLRAARRSLVPRARSASCLRLRALRSRGAGSSAPTKRAMRSLRAGRAMTGRTTIGAPTTRRALESRRGRARLARGYESVPFPLREGCRCRLRREDCRVCAVMSVYVGRGACAVPGQGRVVSWVRVCGREGIRRVGVARAGAVGRGGSKT